MYGRRLLSIGLTITEKSEMGLYKVPMCMSLLYFGVGIMFDNVSYSVLDNVVV